MQAEFMARSNVDDMDRMTIESPTESNAGVTIPGRNNRNMLPKPSPEASDTDWTYRTCPLEASAELVDEIRAARYCNFHHLKGACSSADCTFKVRSSDS